MSINKTKQANHQADKILSRYVHLVADLLMPPVDACNATAKEYNISPAGFSAYIRHNLKRDEKALMYFFSAHN